MYIRPNLILAVLTVAWPLAGCGHLQNTSDVLEPVQIIHRYSGEDTGLTELGVMLVNSHEELQTLASQELIQHEIDFEEHSLIVLALGRQSTGGYWAKITSAQQSNRELFVQGIANAPAPDAMTSQAETFVYDAVVIDKVSAGIELRPEIDASEGELMPAD